MIPCIKRYRIAPSNRPEMHAQVSSVLFIRCVRRYVITGGIVQGRTAWRRCGVLNVIWLGTQVCWGPSRSSLRSLAVCLPVSSPGLIAAPGALGWCGFFPRSPYSWDGQGLAIGPINVWLMNGRQREKKRGRETKGNFRVGWYYFVELR